MRKQAPLSAQRRCRSLVHTQQVRPCPDLHVQAPRELALLAAARRLPNREQRPAQSRLAYGASGTGAGLAGHIAALRRLFERSWRSLAGLLNPDWPPAGGTAAALNPPIFAFFLTPQQLPFDSRHDGTSRFRSSSSVHLRMFAAYAVIVLVCGGAAAAHCCSLSVSAPYASHSIACSVQLSRTLGAFQRLRMLAAVQQYPCSCVLAACLMTTA